MLLTEITGSESFVHLKRDGANWVAVLPGVVEYSARRPAWMRNSTQPISLSFAARPARRRAAVDAEERAAWLASTSLILAQSYGLTSGRSAVYALKPMSMTAAGRRLCAARPVRLRQDHAAQHHFRHPCAPSRGKILFDGVDVTRLSTQKRNIAQVFGSR